MSTVCIDHRLVVADRSCRPAPVARILGVERIRAGWTRGVARAQWGPVSPDADWIGSAPSSDARLARDGVRIDVDAESLPRTLLGAVAHGLRASAHAPVGLLRAWRRMHRTASGLAELRELDDRMLRDIGLARADVERAARGAPPFDRG